MERGVTQSALYSAFASRQALIDAVALTGFDDLAAAHRVGGVVVVVEPAVGVACCYRTSLRNA